MEVCVTVSAIKYINKYIYKGHDKATMQINNEYNEIKRYIACRYVGPSQTYWDIMEFPIYKEHFTIYRLTLYLPNQYNVTFNVDTTGPGDLSQITERSRITLIVFFNYNRDYKDGKHLLYYEFPLYFTYDKKLR